MRLKVFSVRDSKAEAFMRPFFAPTRGMAMRSFSDAINGSDGDPLSKHPEDYCLFELGEFDEVSGELVKLDQPLSLGLAATLKVVA